MLLVNVAEYIEGTSRNWRWGLGGEGKREKKGIEKRVRRGLERVKKVVRRRGENGRLDGCKIIEAKRKKRSKSLDRKDGKKDKE